MIFGSPSPRPSSPPAEEKPPPPPPPHDYELSIVVPLYNEAEALPYLLESLHAALHADTTPRRYSSSYEVVLVDDGSRDGTGDMLRAYFSGKSRSSSASSPPAQQQQQLQQFKTPAAMPRTVRAILFRRNYGQTPALAAGIDYARGRYVVTLDGDLQQEPSDMFALLSKLEQEQLDLVSGWRRRRQDAALRTLFSRTANRLIRAITGVHEVTDLGCSLKAYRACVLKDVRLYGELHRFLPVLAKIEGARLGQLEVQHRAREHGRSKYGLDRTFRVLCDLVLVHYLARYATRPMHWFGSIALVLGAAALCVSVLPSALAFAVAVLSLGRIRPAPIASTTTTTTTTLRMPTAVAAAAANAATRASMGTLLGASALVFVGMGVLAEVATRAWHESGAAAGGGSDRRAIYRVREVIDARIDDNGRDNEEGGGANRRVMGFLR